MNQAKAASMRFESVLAPGQISFPIRGILRRQNNTTVIMGEVTGVDKDQRCVFVNSPDREEVPVKYDYLILATGAGHSYFGHDEFEKFAPGLKSLADAVEIRNTGPDTAKSIPAIAASTAPESQSPAPAVVSSR